MASEREVDMKKVYLNMMVAMMVSLVWPVAGFSQGTVQDASPDVLEAPPSATQDLLIGEGQSIEGTVTSLDPAGNTVSIAEDATGEVRTFSVSDEEVLNDIETGNQVNVTLMEDNPGRVESIQKI